MAAISKARSVPDSNGEPTRAMPCGINGRNVSIGASSVQSAAFDTSDAQHPPRLIRICATGACHYLVGANPSALATSPLLPANVVEYLNVRPGEKIAVIQDGAATGVLNISEIG